MKTSAVGNLNLSKIIQRHIEFFHNNDIFPKEGNEESERGELEALENMLADSKKLTEKEFEAKYIKELTALKKRFEDKEYSVEDGDDYYESYNNTLVEILKIINPIHLYDLSG